MSTFMTGEGVCQQQITEQLTERRKGGERTDTHTHTN